MRCCVCRQLLGRVWVCDLARRVWCLKCWAWCARSPGLFPREVLQQAAASVVHRSGGLPKASLPRLAP